MENRPSHRLSSQLHRRRNILRSAGIGLLGLRTGSLLSSAAVSRAGEANQLRPRAKSLIVVFCTGAISHHDTFDMKPDSPLEIRGEFNPVQTPIPGTVICEHLPKLAARAHKYALIRSLSHKDNNHLMSTHHVLTGHLQPGAFFDKVASRDDWPCYSAGCEYLRPRSDGIPSGVNLPTFLMSSPLTWPGQHAGFLGPMYDPWQIVGDPSSPEFRVDSLTLANEVNRSRLEQRRTLLSHLDQTTSVSRDSAAIRMKEDQTLAFTMLTSGALAQAFEVNREASSIRDTYGRHPFGHSLLLARRLVEAGVPIVQANMGPVQNWDHHQAIFSTLKGRLLSPLDQAVSALLDDLESSGLIDDTMVMLLGEFGRTPKINKDGGRDHWGPCFTGLFAGAGVQGGKIIGSSDEIAAYPDSTAYSPDDLGATIYSALGIDPHAIIHDRIGRPVHLNEGQIIDALYNDSENV